MTLKQAEALRNSLNNLVAACDRVNLNITKCNTRDLTAEDQKIIWWLRRYIVGTRGQGDSYLKKIDKLIDKLTINNSEHHE